MAKLPDGTQPGMSAGMDLIGVTVNAITKRVSALEAGQRDITAVTVTIPEPRSPFITSYENIKGHIRATCNVNIPNPTSELIIRIIRQVDRVDQPTFDTSILTSEPLEPNDDELALGILNQRMSFFLEPNTIYDLVQLIAKGTNLGKVKNPEGPILFTDPPLATFTTPAQAPSAGAPSKPTLARIVNNTVDPDTDGSQSIVTLRTFADETEALTFAAQNTVSVQPKLVDDGGAKAPSPPISIEDQSLTFIDDSVGGLVTGRNYTWTKNTAFDFDGFGTQALATSTITFVAGGFADPSDSLASLTYVSSTAVATDDPSLLLVTFVLHQPTPAYKLKNYTAKRKKDGNPDSDYDLAKNLVVQREDLHDPIYSTPGNISITFPMNVKPAASYLVKLTVRSIQGFTKDFTSGTVSASALTIPAQLSASQGGLSMVDGGSLIASFNDYTVAEGGVSVPADAIYPGRMWQTFTNSGVKINNTATGGGGATIDSKGMQWDNTGKRLKLTTSIHTLGGKPAVRLGKVFRANDACVVCPLFLADTADETIDISFALVDATSGDIVVITASSFVISHTTPSRFMGIFSIPGPGDPTPYTGTDKQWLELRLGSNPTHSLYMWNVELDWGILYRDFKPNANEQAVLDFLNVTPTSAGSGAGEIITEDAQGNLYSPGGIRAGQIFLA